MTSSESSFRNWVKKEYVGCYVKKLPDFKQLGGGCVIGLPDFLVIHNGVSLWFEVKSGFGDTINLCSHFTCGQKVEFNKMLGAGYDVCVACFTKSFGLRFTSFSFLKNNKKKKFC